jgi:hypothetical protein
MHPVFEVTRSQQKTTHRHINIKKTATFHNGRDPDPDRGLPAPAVRYLYRNPLLYCQFRRMGVDCQMKDAHQDVYKGPTTKTQPKHR